MTDAGAGGRGDESDDDKMFMQNPYAMDTESNLEMDLVKYIKFLKEQYDAQPGVLAKKIRDAKKNTANRVRLCRKRLQGMMHDKQDAQEVRTESKRGPNFNVTCTEKVEGDHDGMPFNQVVDLVTKATRYSKPLLKRFRNTGNRAGTGTDFPTRTWQHQPDLRLLVIRNEEGEGEIYIPSGQALPDLTQPAAAEEDEEEEEEEEPPGDAGAAATDPPDLQEEAEPEAATESLELEEAGSEKTKAASKTNRKVRISVVLARISLHYNVLVPGSQTSCPVCIRHVLGMY
jgi:hypothetical protein